MNFKPLLEWMSDITTGLVILFVLVNAVNTNCFQPLDWGLTVIALSLSLFVRIIINITK
ncbi:MAG: hypothetical protein ABH824_07775 [Nanoarchaeota archaeon]|nr:hypothetical protein [Nanoarchaeota archaeon]MBU1631620.1 hypothetical protein [Nanoarchaeota archaeon]MBU1876627.1 hypothetical protein [Nanoarchaeota archaeon]